MVAAPLLLALSLGAFAPPDVLTSKILGVPSQEVLTSFEGCEAQTEEQAPKLQCPMKLFDQRLGASFVLTDGQKVKGIFLEFAVKDGLTETMQYVRPLLAKMAVAFPTHEEKVETNGKRWVFLASGKAISEVRVRKTNAGQWQVTIATVKVGGAP